MSKRPCVVLVWKAACWTRGTSLVDLYVDALALAGLMLLAMTIAVTRFRRTLD